VTECVVSYDYRSDGQVACVRWNDNSVVTLASNHVGVKPVKSARRRVKAVKAQEVPRPYVVQSTAKVWEASLKAWVSKRNNWTSDTIQNEILEIMAHDVQRQIVADIDQSPYIGLVADGTIDNDGMEQFSVTVCYVDANNFVVHDAFLGMSE